MPKLKSTPWRLIWPLPALLLTACAQPLPVLPVEPARVPQLPAQARVSLIQPPSICWLTCSAGLTRERESWRNTLTAPE